MSADTRRQTGGNGASSGERGRRPDGGCPDGQRPVAEMVPTKAKVGSFALRGRHFDVEIIRVDRSFRVVVNRVSTYEEHALTTEQVAALRSLLSDE